MLRFDIITIFPNMFQPILNESILKRAQQKNLLEIHIHDLRDYTSDKHKKVDDRPFGGGPGMVMMPQPIFTAVKKIKGRRKARVVLTAPGGKPFQQRDALRFTKHKNVILICGHYEGVDERVRQKLIDETVSIGDYVLTGGELPAMVVIDAVSRLVPGVLGKEASLHEESFSQNLLEYPHYTRPANFQGMKVPQILLSGHHEHITGWRKQRALLRTRKERAELLVKGKHPI